MCKCRYYVVGCVFDLCSFPSVSEQSHLSPNHSSRRTAQTPYCWVGDTQKHTCLSLFSSKQKTLKNVRQPSFLTPLFFFFIYYDHIWTWSFRWSKSRLRSLLHHRPGPSRCRHLGRETEEVSTQPRVCEKRDDVL